MKPEYLPLTIEKAKQGNQIAFKTLLDHFWNEVYSFQLKRVHDRYLAEEVTIQAFSRAFDRISTYKSNYAFSTWLIAISKNIHIDLIRKSNFQTTRVDPHAQKNVIDETPTAEDQLIKEQNLASLQQNIKSLQPQYQAMIQLRFFQELSYKEMADQLGEPINNIKVRLLRAKKLLAETIKENH